MTFIPDFATTNRSVIGPKVGDPGLVLEDETIGLGNEEPEMFKFKINEVE